MNFNLIEIYKQKKLKQKKEIEDKYEKDKEQSENNLEEYTKKMVSKPCPINSNQNCFIDCIHFENGHFFYAGEGIFGGWYVIEPKCKLWKN